MIVDTAKNVVLSPLDLFFAHVLDAAEDYDIAEEDITRVLGSVNMVDEWNEWMGN